MPMIIKWRGDEYEYTPRILQGGGDVTNRNSNIDAPIFGADTESVHLEDRYEPQCFTLSGPDGQDILHYIEERAFALKTFLRILIQEYGDYLMEKKTAFLYFHNLEYDWLQLVKNDPVLLEMARIGVGPEADVELFRIGSWKVKLKKSALFTGSAPHFTIRIEQGRTGFNLFWRDSFSFFPSSLAKVGKDLKLDIEKEARQEDLGLRDYRKEGPSQAKEDFERYAKKDSRVTQMIGEKIRELHEFAELTKIRASSPSYAIALLYQMMEFDEAIVSGSWDHEIMQLIFDTYRGGRTGGIYHGKVEDVSVYDFHSSYPASMCSLPSFNPNMVYHRMENLSLENVLAVLGETGNAFLRVSGRETDSEYPSLITNHGDKLTPIYGRFENIATTGVEFYVGMKSGSLVEVTIHECVVLLDMDENPRLPFKEFAETGYDRKANSEKGSVEYTSAKLAINGGYGKLIESRDQTLVGARDARTYFPFIPGMEKEFGAYYYQKYIDVIEAGLTMEDKFDDIIGEIIENFSDAERARMQTKMFGDFPVSGRIYGRHVVPAAASLITATSRARLVCFLKAAGALYWDTDSGFVQGQYTDEEMNEILLKSDPWLPANVRKLRVGEELGDLDCEVSGASGYLAGIKRYYLDMICPECKEFLLPPKDCKKCKGSGLIKKYATHGIPALPHGQEKDVIEYLATGADYDYESKPKPMKAKEAKTIEAIGSFQSRRYRSEFHLDERLSWIRTDSGSRVGVVKPFADQGVPPITEAQKERYLKQLTKEAGKIDPIMDWIRIHGFIKTIAPGERFYGEYKHLPAAAKRKYFRKDAQQTIDEFADAIHLSVTDLLNQLGR